MENIRQAVERARAGGVPDIEAPALVANHPARLLNARSGSNDGQINETELSNAYLQTQRIVAHNGADSYSKPYDMLRTQVLRSMDLKGWKILAVTSPTPKCGKTVTAINLALSIARQPERSVLLVDLDLQRPRVAAALGVKCNAGVVGVLHGQVGLPGAMIQTRIGSHRLMVLPAETPTADSSERMACRAMNAMMQQIKTDNQNRIVILDLPPILSGDDVMAILPQVDCVLLVAAAGVSTLSEIDECNKYLQSTDVVRLVLNKVPQANVKYYYY